MKKSDLKGTTIKTLGYTGIVTLSQYTNGKNFVISKVHNQGGTALFDFLADCLAGNFDTARLNCPYQILLLNVENNEISPATSAADFLTILTRPERVHSDTEGIVRYSFIIPADMLVGTKFNAIGLYSKSPASYLDYLAYCTVDPYNSGTALSQSFVLAVDWELHIKNSTESASTV